MPISGFDVSHHQGQIDWNAAARSGREFVVLKVSEGVGYVDPLFAANRDGAAAAGLVVVLYHFARAGDPIAEANYFCSRVGALRAGESVVLDWEVTTGDPVAWGKAFLDRVQASLGVKGLIYLNQSTAARFDWSPLVKADYGLWLAVYDGSASQPTSTEWPFVAVKQYSDKGSVPGVAGPVDVDVFYGSADQLRAYGATSAPLPAPQPVPVPPAPSFDVRAWRASQGATGQVFANLQAWANRMYPGYASTPIAPIAASYGPQTARFLVEFCRHCGIASDGKDLGPKTAAALYAQGFRG